LWHLAGQGRWTFPDGSYFEGSYSGGHRTEGRYEAADGSFVYDGQ
jgi:hypothetical protein